MRFFVPKLSYKQQFLIIAAVLLLLNVGLLGYVGISLKGYIQKKHFKFLKDYTTLAYSVVEYYYDKASKGEIEETLAKTKAKDAIRQMRYGDTGKGYFFGLEQNDQGRIFTIIQPSKPSIEGKDTTNLKDKKGFYFLQAFFDETKANPNGAFVRYWWKRLDSDQLAEKISYVRYFEPWGWVIGTGAYVDDVEADAWNFIQPYFYQVGAPVASGLLLLAFLLYLLGKKSFEGLTRIAEAVKSAMANPDSAALNPRILALAPTVTCTDYVACNMLNCSCYGQPSRCWSKAGSFGEGVCPQLESLPNRSCRNCEVFKKAATNEVEDLGLYIETLTAEVSAAKHKANKVIHGVKIPAEKLQTNLKKLIDLVRKMEGYPQSIAAQTNALQNLVHEHSHTAKVLLEIKDKIYGLIKAIKENLIKINTGLITSERRAAENDDPYVREIARSLTELHELVEGLIQDLDRTALRALEESSADYNSLQRVAEKIESAIGKINLDVIPVKEAETEIMKNVIALVGSLKEVLRITGMFEEEQSTED